MYFVIEKTGQVVGLAKTAKIHYCSKVSYHPLMRQDSPPISQVYFDKEHGCHVHVQFCMKPLRVKTALKLL